MGQLAILDTTLRDGQLGSRQYRGNQLVRMAEALADAGIQRIELPIAYSEEQEEINDIRNAVDAIQSKGRLAVLHVRADRGDVDMAADYGASGITTYKALTDVHRNGKFRGQSLEDAESELLDMVEYAKKRGFGYVRATVEDASRLFVRYKKGGDAESMDYLVGIAKRLHHAGANIISIPDSASLLRPDWAREMTATVKGAGVPVSVHFHDNMGHANENTREAVLAGADEVQLSYLGYADRNGIADLATVFIQLESEYNVDTGVLRGLNLFNLYRKLERLSGHRIYDKHIFSKEAMTVRAGTHTAQTLEEKGGYFPDAIFEFVPDGMLRYVFNKYTSTKLVAKILGDGAYAPQIARIIRSESYRRGANLAIDDVRSIIRNVSGRNVPVESFVKYVTEPKVLVGLTLRRGSNGELQQSISEMGGVDAVFSGYGITMMGATPTGNSLDMVVIGDGKIVKGLEMFREFVEHTSTMNLDSRVN